MYLNSFSPKTQILQLTNEFVKQCAVTKSDTSVDLDILNSLELIFKSQACLNGSFLQLRDKHFCCTSKHHGVDLTQAKKAFENLSKIENESLKQIVSVLV